MKTSLLSELISYSDNRKYIRMITCTDDLNCIPIKVSEAFCIVLRCYDFQLYGFEIIPISSIKEIRYTETCYFFEKVIKAENDICTIQSPNSMNAENWEEIFAFFEKTKEIIIIDIGIADCVNVGRVLTRTDSELEMQCVSPSGIWNQGTWTERYDNISSVQFRNSYTKMFSKYAKEGNEG